MIGQHQSGKSHAVAIGAVQNAAAGASIALFTNDVKHTMDRLCDVLSDTTFNYYATADRIVLEGRGDIYVRTGAGA